MAAATIEKVTVAVAEPAVPPVAVMVTVAVEAADGFPEMTPVDGLITKPVGRVPEVTAYDTEPVKLLAVNAVDAVIADPTVPEMVCVAGETDGGKNEVKDLPPPQLCATATIFPAPEAKPFVWYGNE